MKLLAYNKERKKNHVFNQPVNDLGKWTGLELVDDSR